MRYFICDIDGTVADLEHRRHLVPKRGGDWKPFFDAMVYDPPIKPVVDMVDNLAQHYIVVFVSGRPETHRGRTDQWLDTNLPWAYCGYLFMRAEGDHRSDVAVKRDILNDLRAKYGEPEFVIDDRQSVVDMWREEGIVCLQAAPGDFDKQHYKAGYMSLMVGPTHAGKSTAIAASSIEASSVVSSDAIRKGLCGDEADQSKNSQVFAALHAIVKARIENGLDTVVDATNIRNRDRKALVDLVGPDVEVDYVVFDRPLPAKLADKREGFPEEVIIKQDATFRSNLKAILSGDGYPNVTVWDYRGKL